MPFVAVTQPLDASCASAISDILIEYNIIFFTQTLAQTIRSPVPMIVSMIVSRASSERTGLDRLAMRWGCGIQLAQRTVYALRLA